MMNEKMFLPKLKQRARGRGGATISQIVLVAATLLAIAAIITIGVTIERAPTTLDLVIYEAQMKQVSEPVSEPASAVIFGEEEANFEESSSSTSEPEDSRTDL